MKLLTFYSQSHTELLRDFFMASFYAFPQGIDSLVICRFPQVCPSATYKQPGWDRFSRMKVQRTIDELNASPDGETLLCADCDLQWFGSLEPLLTCDPQSDLLAQDDGPGGLCAGFVRLKVSPAMRDLYTAVGGCMDRHGLDEQFSLNGLLSHQECGVRWNRYDPSQVWSSRARWKLGDPAPPIPDNLIVQHGNWTTCVEDKRGILELVRAFKSSPEVQTC